jgi:hypothetical protein
MTVSLGDILAAIDVVSELVNQCDEMGVDDALAMREAIGQLQSEVKRADSMLTTTAKTQLEGSERRIGDQLYATKPTGKWRFRHDDLEDAIRVRAIGLDKATGEQRSTEDAVSEAIALMHEAFVAPATKPKTELLNKLGYLDFKAIAKWERTGSEIVVTDLSAPEDDA